MELQLQPPADVCFITGAPFQAGNRVVSFLVRDAAGEFRRYDCHLAAEGRTSPDGEVLCRWTRTYKPRAAEMNAERELKLTAESLFLSLTEDAAAGVDENGALKQFLALMLERKRVLKNRGTSESGHAVFEHFPSHRMIEVPAGEMDPGFFLAVRDKLGVLVKGGTESAAASARPVQTRGAPDDAEQSAQQQQ